MEGKVQESSAIGTMDRLAYVDSKLWTSSVALTPSSYLAKQGRTCVEIAFNPVFMRVPEPLDAINLLGHFLIKVSDERTM